MSEMAGISQLEELAVDVISRAKAAGADEADVMVQLGRESEVTMRMGRIEVLKEAISMGLGIRVFKNKKLGFCHSSDFSPKIVRRLISQALELAEITSDDENNGLPETIGAATVPDLQLYDDRIRYITTGEKIDLCMTMERAMFDYDRRVKNSEGVGVYDGDGAVTIADSNGGCSSYRSSYCYYVCNPVAEEAGRLQAASWHTAKRFFSELDSPKSVARTAAERAVRMLGARQPSTARAPVVFDISTGSSMISSLLGALDGDAVYKGASFLAGRLGEDIASSLVTIVDDGLMPRGLGSSPFDGEGLPTGRKEVVSRGKLTTFLYDTYTARKAGAKSTANARREYQSLPGIGPFNFYLQNGESSFDEIIGSVKSGLYLTSLMGFGANTVTGDYSLGASGIWIENGKLAYPVEGITVAANMSEILMRIDMVGNDLTFLGPMASPTFRVSEMTISGA
jgi:PmbA protein